MSHHAPRPSRGALDALRAHAASAVAEGSLRSVARRVGMSADGLRKFIGGAVPTPPMYRKLRAWHDRHPAAEPDHAEEEPAAAEVRRAAQADPPESDALDLGEVPRVVLRFTRPSPD